MPGVPSQDAKTRRGPISLHTDLGSKILPAFRFVDENTEPSRTPRWAELTRRWNKWWESATARTSSSTMGPPSRGRASERKCD